MRISGKISLSILLLFSLSACLLTRDENVRLRARREPLADLTRKTLLVLPSVVHSPDFQLNRDLTQYLNTLLNENEYGTAVITPAGVTESAARETATLFLDGKTPDVELLHNALADFILSVQMDLLYEYYSTYSGDDGLNPAYSVERGGAPGLYETPTEWKNRSFDDLSFQLKARFVLYDIHSKKRVIDKTETYELILEDYRMKNVSSEGERAFLTMIQQASSDFLSWCRERDVELERIYLK
jgi:hypothetical protein